MTQYFYRDGKLAEGVDLGGKKSGEAKVPCGKCGGTGNMRLRFQNYCYKCRGTGKISVKVYTAKHLESLDRAKQKRAEQKEAKRLAREKAYQEKCRQDKEKARQIEGFDMAMVQASLIVSSHSGPTGGKLTPYMERTIAFIHSLQVKNHWTEARAKALIKAVADFNKAQKAITDRQRDEKEMRNDPATWIRNGRTRLVGRIATIKEVESRFGWDMKMLVVDGVGRKFWGTKPRGISVDARGAMIEMTATLERSEKDPIFGFFKRPHEAHLMYPITGEIE